MLTEEQIQNYLARIGYQGTVSPCLDTLKNLQIAHLTHVPYENLDILNGVALSLEPLALYNKIVLQRRGGFCFELQGLYAAVLNQLGFQTEQFAGRIMENSPGIPLRSHRILVVQLGPEHYLCEVGASGEKPRIPLLLRPHFIQTDGVCCYRFETDPFYGWVLQQLLPGGKWRSVYSFTQEPQSDMDYLIPCFYCEAHPNSPFQNQMKISILTAEGNFAVWGNDLICYQKGRVFYKRRLADEKAVLTVLRRYFGLKPPIRFHHFLTPQLRPLTDPRAWGTALYSTGAQSFF